MPQDIPATCDCFGKKFLIDHAISCPKGGHVLERRDNDAKDWGTLGAWVLNPSDIYYKPQKLTVG